jgi:hypothetical protein
MSVVARFYVSEVTRRAAGNTWAVGLQAVSRGEHNKSWAHYTPAGSMTLNIHPESAAGQWFNDRLGKEVAITIDEAPAD